MDNRIPVTLLTGFLGSGKTTLLNKLLHDPGMKDSAVIINELGQAGLDHILVRNVESEFIADNVLLLDSGCLCCTLTNEMADTLRDLFFKRALGAIPEFKRLIIETTGMADPGPIMGNLLNEPVIGSTYRLDAVIVTIDSLYGERQLSDHIEARKQAAIADVLLLTKTDLVNDVQLDSLCSRLTTLNAGATQYKVVNGEIEPAKVIGVGLFDLSRNAQPTKWLRPAGKDSRSKGKIPDKLHEDGITSFTVTLPKPLTWEQVEPALLWLISHFGEALLRLKGIIHAVDQPAPLAIHAVHHTLFPPTLLDGWEETNPISRVVLIGKGLDETRIRERLMQI